ncbi:MAG: hypothetical protein ACI81L_002123 [Verrucomicrobiales bacterium]|jgi:hypothetical protein
MIALWIWAVLDVIATDRVLIRNLDKTVWLLLVLFVPTVGAVGWLALGRPASAGFTPGATQSRPTRRDRRPAPRGLEDSDRWSASTTPPSDGFESTAAKQRRLLAEAAELAKRDIDLDPDDN